MNAAPTPLDAELAAIVAAMRSAGAPPPFSGTPDQARARMHRAIMAARARAALREVGNVEDSLAEHEGLRVPVRVYRPAGAARPLPTIVFFHGGGFVLGSVELMDDIARKLCRDVEAVVVSVEYRLAPEHPFPAAHDDALAATQWAIRNVAALGGDAARIAIAGESAGANLAASTTLTLRDRGNQQQLCAQLLIVPGVDMARDTRMIEAQGRDFPMLTPADLRDIARLAMGDRPERAADAPPSPLRAASLAGLPTAVIAVARHDPLYDEGLAYAERLRQAGVAVELHRFEDMFHPFFGFFEASASARRANDTLCRAFADCIRRQGAVMQMPRRAGALGVHSVDRFVFTVPELREAERFYRAFGLDVQIEAGRLDLRTFGNSHCWASLYEAPGPKRLQYLRLGIHAEDLAAFTDKVRARRFASVPHALSVRAGDDEGLWLKSPDGTPIQLVVAAKVSPNAKTVPRPAPQAAQPGQGAAPARSRRPRVQPRTLSHLLMFTPDVPRMIDFCQDVLGLRLSDRSGDIIAFLHGPHGSDHHLLAFAKSHAPGLHHSSWDVGSIDEVGGGAEQMREAGHDRGWGLGRHVLGSNYFHYVRDPWGSFAEYSFDIDFVPHDLDWPAADHPPEDSLYVWGPAVPEDFITNHEQPADPAPDQGVPA